MINRSSFLYLSFILIFFTLFHFIFFQMGSQKWIEYGSVDPTHDTTLIDPSFQTPPQTYKHLGEGLMGTRKDLVLSALKNQLQIQSVCDRIDQLPTVSLICAGELFDFELGKRKPLSYLPLLPHVEAFEAMELSFELKEKALQVHLYQGQRSVGSFLMDFCVSELNQDSLRELNSQSIQWFGRDLFFSTFASDEYPELSQTERLDFNPPSKLPYSLFVQDKGCMVYEGGQWQRSEETEGKPLLYLSQVDSNQLHFVYWSADGKEKKTFQLPKSQSSSYHRHPKMNFLGLKTKEIWIVLCEEQRETLKRNDLWLFQEGKWKKVSSEDQFMDYLSFKKRGDLFVIQELVEKKGKKEVRGTWFNAQRSQKKTFSFSI